MDDQELNEAEDKILNLEMQLRMSRACSDELSSAAKRLTEMVGAAYTAGWLAGYSTGGTLDDESETNLDWHCGEDWVQDGLRPELLRFIESV